MLSLHLPQNLFFDGIKDNCKGFGHPQFGQSFRIASTQTKRFLESQLRNDGAHPCQWERDNHCGRWCQIADI
jgi:hypothetical protein